MTTKALVERERADLKARLMRIHMLATTPSRAGSLTHGELLNLLIEIEKLAESV